MTSLRHNPLSTSKKRKHKSTKKFDFPAKRRVTKNKVITGSNTPKKKSLSRKKIFETSTSSKETDILSEEENELHPESWVTSIENLIQALIKSAVCKNCCGKLDIEEMTSYRAGLGTKFSFVCTNGCKLSEFFSTKKTRQLFEINRKAVIGSRLIGKRHSGLNKLCIVIGLSSPLSEKRFSEHVKYLEEKALNLRIENMAKAVNWAKNDLKNNDIDISDVVDIPTSFDGSRCSRGWTANREIVSAIAQNTSQVLNVSYKCRTCNQWIAIKKKKKDSELTGIAYLDAVIEHDDYCFKNHDGSPQLNTKNLVEMRRIHR